MTASARFVFNTTAVTANALGDFVTRYIICGAAIGM